jgi:hypothetical protein
LEPETICQQPIGGQSGHFSFAKGEPRDKALAPTRSMSSSPTRTKRYFSEINLTARLTRVTPTCKLLPPTPVKTMSNLHGYFVKLALVSAIFGESAVVANAAPVTLNFWDMQWGLSEYAVAAQKIVDRYNQEHPDVHVVYRSVPWTNWFSTFTTSVASGSAPDISTGAGFQAVYFFLKTPFSRWTI